MPGQRSEGLGHVTHKLSGERYCHGMWSLLVCICCPTAGTWVTSLWRENAVLLLSYCFILVYYFVTAAPDW